MGLMPLPRAWRGPAGPVRRAVMERIGLSNSVGALLSFVTGNAIPGQGEAAITGDDVIWFGSYVVVMLTAGGLVAGRVCDKATLFYDEERAPRADERRRALLLPWREAALSFAYWAGAAVYFFALNLLVEGDSLANAFRAVAMISLGGLTTSALVFLLTERAMRPVFSAVLASGPVTDGMALGIRPRLLLSSVLGSAVPLLLVGVAVLGDPDRELGSVVAGIWLFVTVGAVAGMTVTRVSARSVAEPLDTIRRAMDRVAADDLDVEVPVDDGGEVGQLEAGFNRMVDGLRERRLLQDLFGRHVGVEAARYALEHGTDLGGERRDVSVLFIDVVGSTAMAQTRPAGDVVTMLNDLFGVVVQRVEAEGGWVNKFEGDGALCVFGAPVEQPAHATHALRCARMLRQDLLALSLTHEGLDAGIGVSSGEVVAGNVGAAQRHEYTVIGDPVNEAARLTEEAKRHLGRVLVSDEAVQRAGAEARHWVVADELQLRGRRQPTLSYQPAPSADVGWVSPAN